MWSRRDSDTYQTHAIISSSARRTRWRGWGRRALSFGSEELLVESQKVQDAAAEELGGSPRGSVKVEPLTTSGGNDTGFLQVTATAGSGQRAADLANAYATAIDEVRTGEREPNRPGDGEAGGAGRRDQRRGDPVRAASQLQSLMARAEAKGAPRPS